MSFGEAKRNFRSKLAAFEVWRDNELRVEVREDISIRSKDWQLHAPGIDHAGNIIRSELFIAALKLQEAWLRHVPRFDGEIRALAALIRNPGGLEPKDAAKLWQLLFMIVPCISSTLASIERMFAGLTSQTIGNIVIEEAGQATPQSALGLLWRSKRALIIGDQRQLEPVVLTPPALERRLGAHLDFDLMRTYSPLRSSVQSLADRAESLGTWFSEESLCDNRLWVGLPLVVHRRCGSPMFEIANQIAYDNTMLQGMESNVAVTRARRHLFVIGDVNVWHNRGYFSDLEKALEKRHEM